MNTDINKIEDKDGNKFINTPIGLFGVPEFNDEDFSFEDFWRDDNDLKIYEPPKLIENKNANTELPK